MLKRLLFLLVITIVPGCFDSTDFEHSLVVRDMADEAGGDITRAVGLEEKYPNVPEAAIVSIDLQDANISGFNFGALRPLKYLDSIVLEGTDFNDLQVSNLVNCPSLRQIFLRNTRITDVGVHQLAHLPNLEELGLVTCNVTDDCVDGLLAMKSLKEVHLWDTHVSAEGVKRLRERGIEVLWKGQIPNEEVRRALSALNKRGIKSLSQYLPEDDDEPTLYFRIMADYHSESDDRVLSDLQTLEQFATLLITAEPTPFLLLLNDLSRIEQLYIEQGLIEHSESELTDYFTESHPRSLRELRLILDPLPSNLLARWIRTDGLTVLYLDRQVIDNQVWQAIVEAPTLRKIQFDDCKFEQIDQFSSSERPIKVEIFDWESTLDEEPSDAAKVRRLLNAGEDPPSEP